MNVKNLILRQDYDFRKHTILTVSNLYSISTKPWHLDLREWLDDNRKRLLGLEIGHDFMDMQ